jgi:hypothetical protein
MEGSGLLGRWQAAYGHDDATAAPRRRHWMPLLLRPPPPKQLKRPAAIARSCWLSD